MEDYGGLAGIVAGIVFIVLLVLAGVHGARSGRREQDRPGEKWGGDDDAPAE
jgi:hypothetical protein